MLNQKTVERVLMAEKKKKNIKKGDKIKPKTNKYLRLTRIKKLKESDKLNLKNRSNWKQLDSQKVVFKKPTLKLKKSNSKKLSKISPST